MRFFNLFESQTLRKSFSDIKSSTDVKSKRLLLKALVVVIASAVFVGTSPIYMAKVIDVMTQEGRTLGSDVFIYALVYLAMRFTGEVLVDVRWILINPVLYRISYAFCTLIASRISKVPRNEGRNGDSSGLIGEQISVMSKMEQGSIGVLYGVLSVIIPTSIELLIVCIVIGLSTGPLLTLYMILGGIVFMIGVSFKRDKELSASRIAIQSEVKASSFFSEYISNPTLAREFNAGPFLEKRLSDSINESLDRHRSFFSVKTERSLYLTGITCLVYFVVLFTAIVKADEISATAGSFFLLVVFLDRLLKPLSNASTAINTVQNGLIAIEGGYNLLRNLENKSSENPFTVGKSDEWAEISISNSPEFFTRHDVLHIGRGTWVNLRGPSGVGKSTYLRRIYQKLLKSPGLSSMDVHYLNPAPIIIRGSIFENIALGDSSINRELVSQYWEIWNNKIGNRSINIDSNAEQLSAGETQFLAICRTISRAPEFVFFDEATNSMDAKSESSVWSLIQEWLPQSTVFVVSHRNINEVVFNFVETLERRDYLKLA